MPSGKKTCPECNAEVAARASICDCGHEFTQATTTTTKKKSTKTTAPKVSAIVDVVLLLQKHSKAIKKLDSLDKWIESVQPSETNILNITNEDFPKYKEQIRTTQPLNAVPKRTVTAVWNHLNPKTKDS